MKFNDMAAFVAVAQAGGFREAARSGGVSAASLSVAVQRLEAQLDLRLLNRTTRSVALTEAGQHLLTRLEPLFSEMEASLDVLNGFRNKPSGTLRLNVPTSAARIVLPEVIAGFLGRYPDIRIKVVVEDGFVDVLSVGCDAGIRYDERLEQDMIAIPIGPRVQRFVTAAAPGYLDLYGRPAHPRELLTHSCLRCQFSGGNKPTWKFERDGEQIEIDPPERLLVTPSGALDLTVSAAVSGLGVVHLFEDLLRPQLDSGELEPILEPWWPTFSGPFLYYPGRRHLPAPLRAFVDYLHELSQALPSRA
ncbi:MULTISPECIES: LysR family transcriptional regulator [Pseudomonas]|uniref:LysR family transcriptional regulator n=1 Tax=Pseudomonas TaxID=286 RepID=UPI000CD4AC3F|nr:MULTISPECIES: LysR family transcriptional regulator [Pseudomonas]RBH53685.1 LysR family transcriptional regulator [Pseudomonas sp. MWU13-2860]